MGIKHFKLSTFLCVFIITSFSILHAQEIQITGKVTSLEDEMPMPGVSIIVVGKNKGTNTDFNGDYSIDAEKGDVLRFSYIGFSEQKVTIGDNTVINIQLVESVEALNEVVVTALGISRKEQALGYAISKVDGEELAEIKSINAVNSLAGKVAGVDIAQPNTGSGGSSKIIIRGNTKFNGSNQPLYVIDGVPMDNNSFGQAGQYGGQDLGDGISSVNSDDIETISVLKGPAAAALYGSRGGNGVILITTKSFKKNSKSKFNINFSTNSTFDEVISGYEDVQHVYGQGIGTPPRDIGDATGMWSWGGKMDPNLQFISFDGQYRDYGVKKDNIESFFRTGYTIQNTISLSGGNESANLLFSASDVKMEDIVPNSGLHRNNFTLKGHMKMWEKLTLDAKVNFTLEDVDNRPYLGYSGANTALALLGLPGNIDQQWLQDSATDVNGDYVFWNSATRIINPYYSLYNMKNESNKNRVLGYASLNYHITDWLDFKFKSGIDTFTYDYYNYSPRTTPLAEWGELTKIDSRTTEINTEFLLSANKELNDNWTVGASLGGNIMNYESSTNTILGKNQGSEDVISINNYNEFIVGRQNPRKSVRSFYGFANVSFKDYAFLDVTGRQDWSSTLKKGNNGYFYPSFTGALVLTKAIENIKSKTIPYAKLRASYAEVGGDTDPYAYNTFFDYPYSSNGANFSTVNDITYFTNINPSRTKGYEFGLDAKLFNWRVGLDVTYYNQTTYDEIMNIPISNSNGFESASINAGEINNKGWEVMVNFVPIKTDDLRWDLTFNFANNENKIVKLHEEAKRQTIARADWISSLITAEEGGSYGDIVGYDFKRTEDGTPILGANGLPLRSDEQVSLGNGQYKFTGGITNGIQYKGFRLRALIQIKSGADILSMTNQKLYQQGAHIGTLEGREGWALSESERESAGELPSNWVATGGYLAQGVIEDGVGADGNPNYRANDVYVNPKDYWGSIANSHIIKPFIYDATYVKLREVSLSYSLGPEQLKNIKFLNGLTFSIIGRNLWLIHSNVPNVDPESTYNISNGQGYEYGSLPQRRSYGFNLTAKF
ncbi:SusC/RagA family TonB-linked outer membrane protein [Winogradskyella psychrotolerans]|uniref:SusC/RagA family TonB-linked outer membrane protein n=1 Tax=Winogradskyella psychrotolerans TaxID=1344585 RepID=UPI001C06F4F2|nr:SusC/RagA family TonB-linked outer membrane protein [Winogradskyella psychrotolerans]MBU2921567.1 SusC/RagA family TonB-linked outer membrane protein [Winogradskyella psychrotolerans]